MASAAHWPRFNFKILSFTPWNQSEIPQSCPNNFPIPSTNAKRISHGSDIVPNVKSFRPLIISTVFHSDNPEKNSTNPKNMVAKSPKPRIAILAASSPIKENADCKKPVKLPHLLFLKKSSRRLKTSSTYFNCGASFSFISSAHARTPSTIPLDSVFQALPDAPAPAPPPEPPPPVFCG